VPARSTRNSGEKPARVVLNADSPASNDENDPFGEEVVTLIAESESDSFEAFENFDFSGLRFETSPVAPKPTAAKESGDVSRSFRPPPKTAHRSFIPTAAKSPEKKIVTDSPSFSWRSQRAISFPKPLLAMGAIALLAISGYCGYLYVFSGPTVAKKTELQLSTIGNGHSAALFQLKKAERVMSNLELAYRQKDMPEAGLSSVHDAKQRTRQLIDADNKKMDEANRLYSSGQKKEAQAILKVQIESMKTLQKEIETQIEWLERKVFP
jgi:hypothetical protein